MSLSGDDVRELVACCYGAVDRRDWERVEALVDPRLVVETGSAGPVGWPNGGRTSSS